MSRTNEKIVFDDGWRKITTCDDGIEIRFGGGKFRWTRWESFIDHLEMAQNLKDKVGSLSGYYKDNEDEF